MSESSPVQPHEHPPGTHPAQSTSSIPRNEQIQSGRTVYPTSPRASNSTHEPIVPTCALPHAAWNDRARNTATTARKTARSFQPARQAPQLGTIASETRPPRHEKWLVRSNPRVRRHRLERTSHKAGNGSPETAAKAADCIERGCSTSFAYTQTAPQTPIQCCLCIRVYTNGTAGMAPVPFAYTCICRRHQNPSHRGPAAPVSAPGRRLRLRPRLRPA